MAETLGVIGYFGIVFYAFDFYLLLYYKHNKHQFLEFDDAYGRHLYDILE